MAINSQAILAHRFDDITHQYVERDAILYALGIGLGADPLNDTELNFLFEKNLAVLPTMAVTLGTPGMWVRDKKFGIDVSKLVHAGQSAIFHNKLPPAGSIIATAQVKSLTDRGEGKGAVLTLERNISDAVSGTPYCTLTQTLLLRADGGFGGPAPERQPTPQSPSRAPDHRIEFQISQRAALIYRLSGDWNPLHANPATAQAAGFPRPILHGLASYGIAGWVILKALAASQPARLQRLMCRFSGIVYPGDVMAFSIWHEQNIIIFEASVGDCKVLDQASATLKVTS